MKKLLLLFVLVCFSVSGWAQSGPSLDAGIAKANKRDYSGAISEFNKVIAAKPSDAKAYYNRALARQQLSDFTGALQDLNRTISLNPNQPMACGSAMNTPVTARAEA